MTILIIRTVFLYFVILFALKALGKRQVGELQPIELVVILIISEMGSLYMQSNNIPLMNSIILIAVLTVLQIIITLLNLKSEKCRDIICGHPSILIQKGLVQESELRTLRMNLNDLLEQLRSQGYFNLADIDYALMETNGEISILPKQEKQPLTPGDMNLQMGYEGPANMVVLDGHINKKALENIAKDKEWLLRLLKKFNIEDPGQLFIAGIDGKGEFYYQYKEKFLKKQEEERRAKG